MTTTTMTAIAQVTNQPGRLSRILLGLLLIIVVLVLNDMAVFYHMHDESRAPDHRLHSKMQQPDAQHPAEPSTGAAVSKLLETPLAKAESCAVLDVQVDGYMYHCDADDHGKASMCYSNKSLHDFSGNRCCHGKWLYDAKISVVKHSFFKAEIEKWESQCSENTVCSKLTSAKHYEKQLSDLGHINECDSTEGLAKSISTPTKMAQESGSSEQKVQPDRHSQLKNVFKAFDLNGSGELESGEMFILGKVQQTKGQKNGIWTEEANSGIWTENANFKVMSEMDTSGDGKVQEQEFADFFERQLARTTDTEFNTKVQELLDCVPLAEAAWFKKTSPSCIDSASYCLKYASYCDKADRATVTSADGTKALLSEVF